MKIKLDAKSIAALTLPADKEEDFAWDTFVENFGLRLRRRTDGELSRTFIVQYRADHHTRRPTIGSVDRITPTQARDKARKLLAEVALGRDPQAEKAAKRQQATHTVRATVATYLEARQPKLRPGSFRIAKLYLEGDYFRKLHPMAVTAVRRSDVAECIRAIASKRSAPTAAAARRALSAFFAWSISEGLLDDGANPVDGTRCPDDPTPRDHVPTVAELVAIWNACGDDDFGRIVRLLILLGNRRAEIGGMRASELDLAAGVWVLPAARSKNKRSHTVTLPEAALAIMRSVIPRAGRDHLFGDRASSGFTGWTDAKTELDRRLGSTVRLWRLHDLRRAVATHMADAIGVEPHHIEAVLNHYSGRSGVAGTYNRARYDRAIAAALIRWSAYLAARIAGRDDDDDKIVTLQRA